MTAGEIESTIRLLKSRGDSRARSPSTGAVQVVSRASPEGLLQWMRAVEYQLKLKICTGGSNSEITRRTFWYFL